MLIMIAIVCIMTAGNIFAILFNKKIHINKNAIKLINYIFLIILAELLKPRISSRSILKVLNTLEIILYLLSFYTVIINIYIKSILIEKKGKSISHTVISLIGLLLYIVFIFIFLRNILKVNIITILTPSALITAIAGFSMRATIGSFMSGIQIQIEKPFVIGDLIKVGDDEGTVEQISMRYTKIKTIDGYIKIVPNNIIINNISMNYSGKNNKTRIILPIAVSYDVPPGNVKRSITSILSSVANVDAYGVSLSEYGDYAIIYEMVLRIKGYGYDAFKIIRDEVYSKIWYQFKNDGFEIPYPIRNIIFSEKKDGLSIIDKSYAEKIGKLSLFKDIRRETVDAIVNFADISSYENDSDIIKEGETGSSMFVILDGECEIIRNHKVIAILKKGDFFGEMSLISNKKRNATVRAKGTAQLIELDKALLSVYIRKEPDLKEIIKNVFEKRLELMKSSEPKQKYEIGRRGIMSKIKDIFHIKLMR